MNDVLIVSAARLPIGRFGAALKEVSDWDLGTIPIAEVLIRTGLKGDEIDEVIMAHGFRTGDLPANSSRAVALRAGIPIEKPQFTINKACGGSLRAVSLAAQIIKAGESDIMIAGGMESMSRAATAPKTTASGQPEGRASWSCVGHPCPRHRQEPLPR